MIGALTSPDLDALFWRAEHQAVESAWHGHVPFAHWIVRASAPRVLVELGPDTGVSYAAFCQAVVKAELTTRCFALCPGRRDEHADHGGNPGPGESDMVHRARYGGFSRLLRGTPAEALASFQDASIDLLHIDGGRSCAEARRCFDGWYPKLSRHAVVLLHGTNIRDDGAGVWRLWAELRERYPSFEFLHGNGLGVLALGEAVPAPVLALCRTTDPQQVRRIRERFALLGERGQAEALLDRRSADLERLQAALAAQRKTAEATQQTLSQQVARLRTKLRTAEYRAAQLDAEVRHLADHAAQVRDALQRTENMRRTSQTALEQLWDQLQALHRSASWRISAPLRRMSSLLRGRPQHEPPRKPNLLEHGSRTMPGSAAAATWSPAYQNGARRRRVLFVSGEPQTPGHIYRVTRHAEAARAAGWAAQATSLAELSEAAVFSTDVLVLWRCTWSPEVDFVFYLAEYAGITVLFDVDDLMFKPELARTEIIDGIRTQDFDPAMVADFYRQVQRVLMRSDACICTTRELACHARDFDRTTFILPNGFDAATLAASRLAVRRHRQQADDGLVRIGYASGTRTHQRDFRQAVAGLARVLQDRPACRLVLFREPDRALLDVAEFPELAAAAGQIEWRDKVPLDRLPEEMARFDINLAPLEVGNPFCEAKSELKYFEAALVDVPTVASPTGPMRRAIRDGETGLLATTPEDWYAALLRLVDDPALRQRMARSAHRDVLWRYGPERKQDLMLSLLQQVDGGQHAARAFELEILRESRPAARFDIPQSEVVFIADRMQPAAVTVIVPLYNYAHYIEETLDSVRDQTVQLLDLIVIDDRSTDASLDLATTWARRHADRFNRIVVMQNRANAGLARTRNVGFDAAETAYVLPLDADNRLRPECCAELLDVLHASSAGFAYPRIQIFGGPDYVLGSERYMPMRFAGSNYIDAMAMVGKWAWAAVGGFVHSQYGWEDYEFWCRCAASGIRGERVDEILAEYRFHQASMLRTVTDLTENKMRLIRGLEARHRWLTISRRLEGQAGALSAADIG